MAPTGLRQLQRNSPADTPRRSRHNRLLALELHLFHHSTFAVLDPAIRVFSPSATRAHDPNDPARQPNNRAHDPNDLARNLVVEETPEL
jgi:hypothetical protein